jgi:hypothetical protein
LLLLLVAVLFAEGASSQNVMVNILTQKSGMVKKGNTLFLEVTINNTDPADYVGVYKIRAQVSVPADIASIDTAGHILPTGWTVTSNNGSIINLSNGKDMIAANDSRTLLIALRGIKAGGPSTISCQLTFSDGNSPGTTPGTLKRDNPADNSSTTTIMVHK